MCVVTGSRVGYSTVDEHVLGSTFGRRMGSDIYVNATSQTPSNSIVCGSLVTNYATVLFG